ncbi:MAG: hypothetical protein NDI69_09120 [Bacteriovoracaceae bacterium]|nr:hypothetical protein [Bacteriovoracaceae bacterium]
MSSEKKVSEVQQAFEFNEEHNQYMNDSDEEFLTLLEEVLAEVFVQHEDEESYVHLEGQSIYFLGDEKEISSIEKYDQMSLDEGSPATEDFDTLAIIADEYFKKPASYSTGEVIEEVECFITGFIQLYAGDKFDVRGNMITHWKSTKEKIVIHLNELYEPERIISLVESKGFKWSNIVRVIFYGHPLAEIIGSKFYERSESRELVVWDEKYPGILLAVPEYEDTEAHCPSTFEIVNSEIQNSILTGSAVNFHRSTIGHWQMTLGRIEEMEQEELESRTLLQFTRREKRNVKSQNTFKDRYSEGRLTINGLNDGSLKLDSIFELSTSVLEDILFLAEKCSMRLEIANHYHQIRSLYIRNKLKEHLESNSPAMKTIQSINQGEIVEIHLLSEQELKSIFDILWGNIGIRIIESRKDIYLAMKDRLLRFRSRKLRSPA